MWRIIRNRHNWEILIQIHWIIMIQLYWIITTTVTCQIKNLNFFLYFLVLPSNLCICISHFLQDLNNTENFTYEYSCTTTKIKELSSLSISTKVKISLKAIITLAFSIQYECNKIILVRKSFSAYMKSSHNPTWTQVNILV